MLPQITKKMEQYGPLPAPNASTMSWMTPSDLRKMLERTQTPMESMEICANYCIRNLLDSANWSKHESYESVIILLQHGVNLRGSYQVALRDDEQRGELFGHRTYAQKILAVPAVLVLLQWSKHRSWSKLMNVDLWRRVFSMLV